MTDDVDDGGLFAVDAARRVDTHSAAPKPPVDKTFRVFDPDQGLLLPPSLDDWLPAGHLARFVAELVDEHLDLARIQAVYTEGRGGPPYDPRLMVRVLLYGYTIGVRSSRRLEAACVDVVAFRWLAAGTESAQVTTTRVPLAYDCCFMGLKSRNPGEYAEQPQP